VPVTIAAGPGPALAGRTPPLDLTDCDREPIHLPGSIQPHGFLLAVEAATALDASDAVVRYASETVQRFLGIPAQSAVGRPLAAVLPPDVAADLLARSARATLGASASYLFAVRLGRGEAQRSFEVVAWNSGPYRVFEFEEVAEEVDPESLNRELYDIISRIHALQSVEEICAEAAGELRRLTGFDRVLVYCFENDGSGLVLSESRNDRLPSYAGLRFPASDVPRQARRLYELNRIRIIPDVAYEPSPLVSQRGAPPLDLSGSILRSVSPIHRQYMRNMGTAASMSVSILAEGRLWGLASLHHATPRRIPFRLRSACDLLMQIYSARIAARERESHLLRAVELRRIHGRLLAAMVGEEGYASGLAQSPDDLLALVGASGAALVAADQCTLVGATPPSEAVLALAQWLLDRGERDLFVSEHLSDDFPPAAQWTATASGLLALSLSRVHRSYLLWFRPEFLQTVHWAGEPVKPRPEPAGAPEIHPRRSFETWSETVRARAKSWSVPEIEAALELRSAILAVVLKHAEEVADLATELEFANQELEAFSYSVSHDLRAPLRHISGFSELLLEEERDSLTDRGRRYVQTVIDSARFAGLLVDTLLNFSRIARSRMDLSPLDMNALADDEWHAVMEQEGRQRTVAFTRDPLPSVEADLILMRQVLRNLFSNAVKYARGKADAAVHFGVVREGSEWVFSVRDNGAGFDQAYVHKLFGVFQRLHRLEEFEGTGIGLANIRRIVARHGGRTWAEGKLGAGAVFYFTMPVRNAIGKEMNAQTDSAGGR
jgi:chemotaxis family two-component system sensor kinase Cph1